MRKLIANLATVVAVFLFVQASAFGQAPCGEQCPPGFFLYVDPDITAAVGAGTITLNFNGQVLPPSENGQCNIDCATVRNCTANISMSISIVGGWFNGGNTSVGLAVSATLPCDTVGADEASTDVGINDGGTPKVLGSILVAPRCLPCQDS